MLAGAHGIGFAKEHDDMEAFAAAHGYTIRQGGNGEHYVYCKDNLNTALCTSSMRSDAVRIAYALANLFPPAEAVDVVESHEG